MDEVFRILLVCRANVCRSPLAELLLTRAVARTALAGAVAVGSAGTHAQPGELMCAQAAGWSHDDALAPRAADHRARTLSAGALHDADLVLSADRDSRATCAMLDPACRPRLFTLGQAAFLADSLEAQLAMGRPIEGAPPMPVDPTDRLRWLVGEMDAARSRLSMRAEGSDDIEDRHGPAPHTDVFEAVAGAARRVGDALVAAVG